MAITGYTFDRSKATATTDASLYAFLNHQKDTVIPGRGNEMPVTTSGLVCTIGTGQAIIQGRLVEITAPETVIVPAKSKGYLCITIDLSRTNTSSGTPGQDDYAFELGQLKVEFVQDLIMEDLNNGGRIYNFNLVDIDSTGMFLRYSVNSSVYQSKIVLRTEGQAAYFHAAGATEEVAFVLDPANLKDPNAIGPIPIKAGRFIGPRDTNQQKLVLSAQYTPISEGVNYKCVGNVYAIWGSFRGTAEGTSILFNFPENTGPNFEFCVPAYSARGENISGVVYLFNNISCSIMVPEGRSITTDFYIYTTYNNE